MPAGNTIDFSVHWRNRIANLKWKISLREGIHPHCQQITFNGRVLEDGQTFHKYSIHSGSTLDLLMVNPESKYIHLMCVTIEPAIYLLSHNLLAIAQTQRRSAIRPRYDDILFCDDPVWCSYRSGPRLKIASLPARQDGNKATLNSGRMDIHVSLTYTLPY